MIDKNNEILISEFEDFCGALAISHDSPNEETLIEFGESYHKNKMIDELLNFSRYYNKEAKSLVGESVLMIDRVHIIEYLNGVKKRSV